MISVLKTFNNIQDLNNHVDAFHIYFAQVCRQHAEPCSTCDVCGLTATPLSNLPDHLSRHDAHNDVTFEDLSPIPQLDGNDSLPLSRNDHSLNIMQPHVQQSLSDPATLAAGDSIAVSNTV